MERARGDCSCNPWREKKCKLNITNETKVLIKEYRLSKYICRSFKFVALSLLSDEDHRIDLLRKMSLRFHFQFFKEWCTRWTVSFVRQANYLCCTRQLSICTLETICALFHSGVHFQAWTKAHFISSHIWPAFFPKASGIENDAVYSNPVRDAILLLGRSIHWWIFWRLLVYWWREVDLKYLRDKLWGKLCQERPCNVHFVDICWLTSVSQTKSSPRWQ